MTPEQHNKYLGFAHLGYAVLHVLLTLFIGVMMLVIFNTVPPSSRGNPPPQGFFIAVMSFVVLLTAALTIPSLIAAYALLKRKRWAKVAAIIAGVFAAPHMPLGTAVGVYTFWFIFSEPGRLLYDQPAKSLSPPAPGEQTRIHQEKQHEYFPPAAPPDWR